MEPLTSISKRKPRKAARTGGAAKAIVDFGNVIDGLNATMHRGETQQNSGFQIYTQRARNLRMRELA